MTLISILIPTYNRAAFLKESIQSALAQTYREIEIVVLDDASSDATTQTVATFDDARLRYVRHPQNLGIVGNWQAGLSYAHGEFFCFLHDDDTLEPEFVARLLEPMEQDAKLIVAFCDHWVMDVSGNLSAEASDNNSRYFRRNGLEQGVVADFGRSALINLSLPVGAALFRRALIQPHFLDERARGSIDMYLFLNCALTGYKAYYVPERLMNYRIHEGGMSRSMPVHMAEGHIFRYHSILSQPTLSRLHTETHHALRSTLAQTAITLAIMGQPANARRWARASWNSQPNRIALLALVLSCSGRLASRIAAPARCIAHAVRKWRG